MNISDGYADYQLAGSTEVLHCASGAQQVTLLRGTAGGGPVCGRTSVTRSLFSSAAA
jgi:hypothetical protein